MGIEKSDNDPSFAEMMEGVKKISDDRVNVYRDRAKKNPSPRRNTQIPESNLDFANIDYSQQADIKNALFDHGVQKKLERKIRQGQFPIEDQIDLHGYTQQEAISALGEFLQRAISAKFKLLVIIHGKGSRSASNAVLRPLAQHWLAQQASVLGWCPAQPRHGGTGASYVYLRVHR